MNQKVRDSLSGLQSECPPVRARGKGENETEILETDPFCAAANLGRTEGQGLGCVFLSDAMLWHDAGSSLDIPR